MAELPRIAVLIPAYNAGKTLRRAVESLNANDEPHDIVIVDDASSHPIETIIASQPNLTILRCAYNLGVYGALNFGLRYIFNKGYEFIARLDADDEASPDRLAVQRAFMDANPDVAVAGSWGRFIDENGRSLYSLHHPLDHEAIVKNLFYNNSLLTPSMMVRARLWEELGGFRRDSRIAEDYEMARRFARTAHVANIPRYLVTCSALAQGLSQSRRRAQLVARLRIQWLYRDFLSPHFYAGILKTLALWFMPVSLITKIKQRCAAYQTQVWSELPANSRSSIQA